eukprot:UC4_evm1s817
MGNRSEKTSYVTDSKIKNKISGGMFKSIECAESKDQLLAALKLDISACREKEYLDANINKAWAITVGVDALRRSQVAEDIERPFNKFFGESNDREFNVVPILREFRLTASS